MTTTLAAIQSTPIHGNAHHDRILFDKIHDFVIDPNNSMTDKITALTKLDQAMGVDDVVTESSVLEYIKEST